MHEKRGHRLLVDRLGDVGLRRSGAAIQEAAGGEEFGVEKGGTGGAADEVVGEESEFDIEERAFADAADYGGHAVAGVDVAARLRAVVAVDHVNGMTKGGRQRGEFGVHFKIAQGFADFFETGNFFEADGDALEVAFENWDAIAMCAETEASVDEASAVPFTEELLRFGLHFFFFAADEGDDVGVDIHGSDTRIACARDSLQRNGKNFFEAEGVGERFEDEDETCRGTIWIGDDEASVVAAIFLLGGNGVEMRGVDFGNEERDVGIHAVIF